MKNKNFKDLVEDYLKLGLISPISQIRLNLKYDNVDDSIKEKMDEYSQVVLDDYLAKIKYDSPQMKTLVSIKNNVQFFAWLAIVSLVLIILMLCVGVQYTIL
tara:strand:- start:1248 stop:1553 length:306 start_codon:yes stop_codon:yes gene_type:complete